MKYLFSTIALAVTFSAPFAVQASDLRDVKESQLTTQQKKEAYSKMSDAEIELIDNYETTANYKSAISGATPPDTSYNEKLKIIRKESTN